MIRSPYALRALILLALFSLFFVACDDDGGTDPADTTADTQNEEDQGQDSPDTAKDQTSPEDQGQEEVDSPSCDHQGFEQLLSTVETGEGLLLFEAIDGQDNPYNYMFMELLWDQEETGSFSITDENYKTCTTCLRASLDCDSATKKCAKTFLATQGTLVIDAWGEVGSTFSARLEDVIYQEVVFEDEEDPFVSTLVEGGETWCMDALPLEAQLEEM